MKRSQIIGRKTVLGNDNLNELILGLFFCLTSAGFKYFFPVSARTKDFYLHFRSDENPQEHYNS